MTLSKKTTSDRLRHIALLCAFGAACSPFDATAPEGFAAFEQSSPFRAASSDGVVYRVRHEANEPEADLAFWQEALKKRMDDAGYTFVSDGAIEASGRPGYVLEMAAPLGQIDYAYLIAIFVVADQLVVVESAGEVSKLAAHRDAIRAAVQKLDLRG